VHHGEVLLEMYFQVLECPFKQKSLNENVASTYKAHKQYFILKKKTTAQPNKSRYSALVLGWVR